MTNRITVTLGLPEPNINDLKILLSLLPTDSLMVIAGEILTRSANIDQNGEDFESVLRLLSLIFDYGHDNLRDDTHKADNVTFMGLIEVWLKNGGGRLGRNFYQQIILEVAEQEQDSEFTKAINQAETVEDLLDMLGE